MVRSTSRDLLLERADIIKDFYQSKRRMPSYSEIGEIVGLSSKSTVAKLVRQLHNNELIDIDSNGRLLPGPMRYQVRMLGTVEAGFPDSAEEDAGEPLSLEDLLIKNPQDTFLLKVSGDSMIEAGILAGDLVVVDRRISAQVGNIVIAEVDGKWTMKRLHQVGKKMILLAANKKYPPIEAKHELRIAGVVTSVIRKLI